VKWTHAILEIYSLGDEGWPEEGTPADWIEAKSVGWCNGDFEDMVRLTPLWKLLCWKARSWLGVSADASERRCEHLLGR